MSANSEIIIFNPSSLARLFAYFYIHMNFAISLIRTHGTKTKHDLSNVLDKTFSRKDIFPSMRALSSLNSGKNGFDNCIFHRCGTLG